MHAQEGYGIYCVCVCVCVLKTENVVCVFKASLFTDPHTSPLLHCDFEQHVGKKYEYKFKVVLQTLGVFLSSVNTASPP